MYLSRNLFISYMLSNVLHYIDIISVTITARSGAIVGLQLSVRKTLERNEKVRRCRRKCQLLPRLVLGHGQPLCLLRHFFLGSSPATCSVGPPPGHDGDTEGKKGRQESNRAVMGTQGPQRAQGGESQGDQKSPAQWDRNSVRAWVWVLCSELSPTHSSWSAFRGLLIN